MCNCRKKGDVLISIHALREEGDGATVAEATAKYEISIHALREEGDCPTGHRRPSWQNFYPRPPRGGRHRHLAVPVLGEIISIHALREEGDLFNLQLSELIQVISIHALREEGDRYYGLPTKRVKNISIHALREEGDLRMAIALQHIFISIHALREEGDRWTSGITLTITIFLSTPSARRATF